MQTKRTQAYDPYDHFTYGRTLHLHPHALSDRHGDRMSRTVFAVWAIWFGCAVALAGIGLFFTH